MSYYQRSKFVITTHALVRARQRIPGLQNDSDLMIRAKLLEMIAYNSYLEFSDNKNNYYHLYKYSKQSLYIVTNPINNNIITVRKITQIKKLQLTKK